MIRPRLGSLVEPASLVVLITGLCAVLITTYAIHGYALGDHLGIDLSGRGGQLAITAAVAFAGYAAAFATERSRRPDPALPSGP